jgi:hypothetical protein
MILLFDFTRVVGSPLNISRMSLRRTFIVRNQTRFPLGTQLDLIRKLDPRILVRQSQLKPGNEICGSDTSFASLKPFSSKRVQRNDPNVKISVGSNDGLTRAFSMACHGTLESSFRWMFTVLGLLLYGPKVLHLKGLEKFGGRQLVLQCFQKHPPKSFHPFCEFHLWPIPSSTALHFVAKA